MSDSNGSNGPIIGVLLALLILLVGIGGFYIYQSQSSADITIDVPGVSLD